MSASVTREQVFDLLREYNKEPSHILHTLTVGDIMQWYAKELGHGDGEGFWGVTGLLHDIDFELYPEEHCAKASEFLRPAGANDELIRAVCCHGYGICSDVEPVHKMEKVLFASDELTGLVGTAARMRPSKSMMDTEVSSLKGRFKDKRFAAGCSRDMIVDGAKKLDWTLEELMEKTILATRSYGKRVQDEMDDL